LYYEINNPYEAMLLLTIDASENLRQYIKYSENGNTLLNNLNRCFHKMV